MQRFRTFLLEQDTEYSTTFAEFKKSLPQTGEEWKETAKGLPKKAIKRVLDIDPLSPLNVKTKWSELNAISDRIAASKDPVEKLALEREYDKVQLELDKQSTDLAIMSTGLEIGGAVGGALTSPTGVGAVIGAGAYLSGVAGNIYSGAADIRSGFGDISQGQYWDATTRIGGGAINIATSALGGYSGVKAIVKDVLVGRRAVKATTGVEKEGLKIVAQRKNAEAIAKGKEAAKATKIAAEVDAAVTAGTKRPVDLIMANIDKAEADLAAQKAARLKTRADAKLTAKEKQMKAEIKAAYKKAYVDNVKTVGRKGLYGKYIHAPAKLTGLGAKALLPVGAFVAGRIGGDDGKGFGGGEGGGGGGTPQFVSGVSPLGSNVGRIK